MNMYNVGDNTNIDESAICLLSTFHFEGRRIYWTTYISNNRFFAVLRMTNHLSILLPLSPTTYADKK
ncbi:MAG: hypothetical protein JWR38_2986 [Mucilaginibacter sp.]|nr:hypothetical protein [Mucilaginibacter sp.]